MAVLGLSMTELPNGIDKIKTYALHKSIGISVLALVLLRLVWRLFAGPAPVAPGPRWQPRAAAITHGGLYALLLAIPISGWAFNSARSDERRVWKVCVRTCITRWSRNHLRAQM